VGVKFLLRAEFDKDILGDKVLEATNSVEISIEFASVASSHLLNGSFRVPVESFNVFAVIETFAAPITRHQQSGRDFENCDCLAKTNIPTLVEVAMRKACTRKIVRQYGCTRSLVVLLGRGLNRYILGADGTNLE